MFKFLRKIFNVYSADQHFNIVICGLRIRWKNSKIDRLSELCCIPNIKYLEEQNIKIAHPFGILIHEGTKVGKNCVIYQHVTIGSGSYNAERKRNYPYLGDNVQVGANAVLVGGINIGNNVTISAGSVVIRDVPDNVTVAGNPARIIKNSSKPITEISEN